MEQAARRPRSTDWVALLSTAALITVMALFAIIHFQAWLDRGEPVGLGLMIQETLAALLLLSRRRARTTDRSWRAWLVTGFGSFGMLASRPTNDPLFGLDYVYIVLQLVGTMAAVVSLFSLGRSFGLVAANRGIQTRGPYRFVRHPVYASYIITHVAYLLENPSLYNVAILVGVYICQYLRITSEEELLADDPAYQAYRARVRYRLAPFLY